MDNNKEPRWRRVMGFLPVNTADEVMAAQQVIHWLRETHTGFTATRLDSGIIEGHYRRWDDGSWDLDRIAVVFVDERLDDVQLERLTRAMRKLMHVAYQQRGSPQEAVWVTVVPLDTDPLIGANA